MRTLAITSLCIIALFAATASAHPDPRTHVRHTDPCLAAIIDRENPRWDPTVYNHQGSGAYGLPQALPGHKMASAGPDWRTNPWTQLKWAKAYVNSRYGGSCQALAAWKRKGWY